MRLVTSRAARRSPSAVLVWAGLLVLNVIVNNPVSNARYWFLTVLVSLLFTAFPSSAAMYRSVLAMGVVGALVLFPYADRFRYDSAGYRPVDSSSVFEPLATKDYDQTVMFANTITWVDTRGHTYGRQLAGTALFFVPRSVWNGKPEDTGVRVGQWMGMNMTNLSSPLWTELWVDFGVPGMVGAFALIGYAAARTDRRYARAVSRDGPGPGSVLAVTAPLVAGYTFILLRGPLLQSMRQACRRGALPAAGHELPSGRAAPALTGARATPVRTPSRATPVQVATALHPDPRHRPQAAPGTPASA